MTEEEWEVWEIDRARAMMNAAPKPSLENRMGWLEADAAAQRMAILKLERAVFIHSCSVAIQGAAITWLIWKVLT
jgi:uncharacterized coiled-coil protein SlyX